MSIRNSTAANFLTCSNLTHKFIAFFRSVAAFFYLDSIAVDSLETEQRGVAGTSYWVTKAVLSDGTRAARCTLHSCITSLSLSRGVFDHYQESRIWSPGRLTGRDPSSALQQPLYAT